MGDASSLGIEHFLAQSDAVARVLLAILALMSVISWYLIVAKGIGQILCRRRSAAFLSLFWNAASLDQVRKELEATGVNEPFGHLTANALRAQQHHDAFGAGRLDEAGSEREFLTRTIRKVLDEETTAFENGLTALATVGATAPFVGLFGTVWGVYHALITIGTAGSGMLDKVAGPVGEALIMTGIGLAVALPAVMGYNWLTRSNRVLAAKLDAFAFELLNFLLIGRTLQAAELGGRESRQGREAVLERRELDALPRATGEMAGRSGRAERTEMMGQEETPASSSRSVDARH
jgi:biopolymer transport protein ExbB